MVDYRKLYARFYGIKWDSNDFEIHHIDRNRDNNDIANLVLLPKALHIELHRVYNELDRMLAFTSDPLLTLAQEVLSPYGGNLATKIIDDFRCVLYKSVEWGRKKSFHYGRGWGDDTSSIIVVELDDNEKNED